MTLIHKFDIYESINEIKTALLVMSRFLFIVMINYLKSNDIFVSDRSFFAIYEDVEEYQQVPLLLSVDLMLVAFRTFHFWRRCQVTAEI